jgi:hypothetical protein
MYDAEKCKEFANLMAKIDFEDRKSRRVFAEKILEEVRDRVANEDIMPLIAEVKSFAPGAEHGFKYKRGLVSHVVEPGSYVPRSRPGQTVVMVQPLTVAVAPEEELGKLESGDFESVQDMIDMAKDELMGKRTALVWNALDAAKGSTTGAINLGGTVLGFAHTDTVATKQNVLNDALDNLADGQGVARAIIGRRKTVSWIQEITTYGEATLEERDRNVLTRYRGLPIITVPNYIDSFDQSRIQNDRFFIVGENSVKVGFLQELRQLDGIDVDTATWHARIWEQYGILILFADQSVKIRVTPS